MQKPERSFVNLRPAAVLLAAMALGSVAACNKPPEPRTVGEKIDATIATAEKKADQAADDVKDAAKRAARATEKAAERAGEKIEDATKR